MNRPVITGLGCVSALGIGAETFWRRLAAGESGLRPMRRIDPAGLRNELAGEVPEDDWRDHGDGRFCRPVAYLRCACDEALAHAGLVGDGRRLVAATNFGAQDLYWRTEEAGRVAGLDFSHQVSELGYGEPIVLSNACSSGTHALGHAADLVRLGQAEVAVAAGFDELGAFCLSGLSILHTISADTIRPFDAKRSGTIFGEGAAALVVEDLEHARSRGAEPLAEVLGYGVNNNGFHMTAPDKGGQGMVAAMRLALAQAGLEPSRIGHVNAHATGTEYHDPAEVEALKAVLGEHAYAVPVAAIKAATGHSMGAAGAMEAVACVLALRHQFVPPTLNHTEPDPACDLDCVPAAGREHAFEVAMSVSAGLGGNNAAVLIGAVR